MSDFLRINQNTISWGSVIFKVGIMPYTGLTAIEFGDKRERIKAYGLGAHQAPRGRSRGKYSTDPLKTTWYEDSANEVVKAMALLSPNGLSYGDAVVPIILQTVELGLVPSTITFDRCCITSVSAAYAEDAESKLVDIEWDVMAIYRNKRTLFDSSRGVL